MIYSLRYYYGFIIIRVDVGFILLSMLLANTDTARIVIPKTKHPTHPLAYGVDFISQVHISTIPMLISIDNTIHIYSERHTHNCKRHPDIALYRCVSYGQAD